MENSATSLHSDGMPDPQRRLLLTGLIAAYASSFIPRAMAQPIDTAVPESFVQVSNILTGQTSLDGAQAQRLYQALVSDDPGFSDQQQRLLALIQERHVDPMQLQTLLDTEKSALAPVPRKIVSAWYTGIVGEGERARCITFETNLLNVITADKLKPPSYSYGVYGSWAPKPA